MTLAEARLWQRLRGNRLAGLHIRRQQVIDGFIADFYCHAAAVVVEVDGSSHEGRQAYDAERDDVFAARGLFTLRFSNDDVLRDVAAVVRRIESVCLARQARG